MDSTAMVIVIELAAFVCLVAAAVVIAYFLKIRRLENRLDGVEAALLRMLPKPEAPQPAETLPTVEPPPVASPPPPAPEPTEHVESLIGRRWLALGAVALIFTATAFFLKYAFESGWIGELGRVTLGVASGLAFVWCGFERHRKGWRHLTHILTGGGVAILYLSIYAAFAYYHLISQPAAFVILAIIVAQAHLLSLAYNARSIAVLSIGGGFFVPILLSTGQDRYAVLFTYFVLLDLGTLGVVLARRWRWVGSFAYLATQAMFWAWHAEHYHPDKRIAALLFQTAVFVIFLLADFAPTLRRTPAGWEETARLIVNPLAFFAACYAFLNEDHHNWMAPLAIALAIVYAALARLELILFPKDRRALFVTLGTALAFVTLAVPIQLESNWITIAWALEALALLWASFEVPSPPLRALSTAVFALAGFRFLAVDTPWDHRAIFTPVFNRYYLGMLALAACLAAAAYFYHRAGFARLVLVVGFLAFGVFWLGSSVETFSFFDVRAGIARAKDAPGAADATRQLRWAAQLSLSLFWTACGGALISAGFHFRRRALRAAGLALFALTLGKALIIDIPELRQFYRIVALLALGLVLLAAAWAYQRISRREVLQ